MTVLTITLLGTFAARRDEVPITQFRTDKVRALLAYLAVEAERPHARSSLAALLWPDQGDAVALNNLSQTLSRLREAIGDAQAQPPFLRITRHTVQWNGASATQLDVTAFTRLARSPAVADRERAAALYTGALLPGFFVHGCPEFDAWLMVTREHLERQALDVLDTLARAYLAARSYTAAEAAARRQLLLDPWREAAHRQVMASLAGANQRTAALAHYAACRRILAEELGVEPDAQTTALCQAIKDDSWQPSAGFTSVPALTPADHVAPPVKPVPTPLTAMVGRERELAQLIDLLDHDRARIVTVVGVGGVGKTRLALQAAQQLRAQRPDVHWLVLTGSGGHDDAVPRSPDQVATQLATTIAEALALAVSGTHAVTTQVVHALRDRAALLVLDNLEHLLAGTPWLLDLLHNAPGIQLLITSRERLNVAAEAVVPLDGLVLPPTDDDGDAANYAGVQLFLQHAARTVPTLTTVADDMPAVVRVCRLLEGMPLGLELAAHWVAHYSVAEIADALLDNLDLLTTTRREVDERHRSLRAVFAYSWRLLQPEEQAALARLSVFRGSFSREAAQTIAYTNVTVLAALVNKSLLRQAGVGRYAVHELLRQFAAEQLRVQDAADTTYDQHARYYLDLCGQQEAVLRGAQPLPALQLLREALPNIRQAWRRAIDRQMWALLSDHGWALALLYRLLGLIHEGAELFSLAVQRLDADLHGRNDEWIEQPAIKGRLLGLHGFFLHWLTDYAAAISRAQAAIEHTRRAGDTEGEAFAAFVWGAARRTRVNTPVPPPHYRAAREHLKWAITLCQTTTPVSPVARLRWRSLERECQYNLVFLLAVHGDYTTARMICQQALQDTSGDRFVQEGLLSAYAELLENEGFFSQALGYREQALQLACATGSSEREAANHNNLAGTLLYLGQYATARTHGHASVQRYQQLGLNAWHVHHNVSLIASGMEAYPEALAHAQLCLDTIHARGDFAILSHGVLAKGNALIGLRRWQEAQAVHEEVLARARECALLPVSATALARLAEVALAQAQHDVALVRADEALELLRVVRPSVILEPLRSDWACYQALAVTNDPRAEGVLRTAYMTLMQQAERIEEPMWRHSFLEKGVHRKIVRAWAAQAAGRAVIAGVH